MNIVIIGAGDVGRYIASILSKEQHNVILIDKDQKVLQDLSLSMDVATRLGSGTDWQLLDDLMELSPSLLIALTGDDEKNLVACTIAKHLGYPRTVARVRDSRYLNRARLDFGRLFAVDYFIGPELLVAQDILKYMISPGSVAAESFAHGAVQMRTFIVPSRWRKFDKPLSELSLPSGMMVGLIRRDKRDKRPGIGNEGKEIIFPHGSDYILPGDEVTFIGEADVMAEAHHFLGISQRAVHSVAIVGGSLTGVNLAQLLGHYDIDVRLIEKDYNTCCVLADQLPKAHIMNHDATDYEFLLSEKIGASDVFVACTSSDETNLLAGLLGKQAGCQDVVVLLSNTSYAPFISQLGLNHAVSPRISTANHILSQVLSGKVSTLVSLYENQAEILEVNVSMNSKLVGIPLSELGPLLPKDFLICMIQNRGRTMIAHGSRIISPGDTVIVISSPKHVRELEKVF
jgi:trk system potassium uptake protein TrkA